MLTKIILVTLIAISVLYGANSSTNTNNKTEIAKRQNSVIDYENLITEVRTTLKIQLSKIGREIKKTFKKMMNVFREPEDHLKSIEESKVCSTIIIFNLFF